MKKVFTYKKFIIFFIILQILFLIGCDMNPIKLSINSGKPFNFYYTNLLSKNIKLGNTMKCVIFDTNLYKEKELPAEENQTIKNFLNELTRDNFIEKPSDLPQKPIYKIFFKFDNDKYVINVYNNKYISVYPWDGSYSMDYIDMSSVHTANNIYYLCKYVIPSKG